MVDFRAQLQKGFKAHEQASAAKDEIRSVFTELTRQVQEYTNGRVGVTTKQELASFSEFLNRAAEIAGAGSTPPVPTTPKLQSYIVAYDISRGSTVAQRLALWSESNTGYPCTIRFDGNKQDVYDRKSLEVVLGELLASPDTGRIISAIAAKPPKPPEDSN